MNTKKIFLLLCGVIPALFFNSLILQASNYSQSSNINTVQNMNTTKDTFSSLTEDTKEFSLLDEQSATFDYLEGQVKDVPPMPKEIDENKQVQNADDKSSNKAKEETSPSDQGQPQRKNIAVSRGGSIPKESPKESPKPSPKQGAIGMSSEERYWLEKLIEAEAADEPYQGKLAVANIIANRVKDGEYGHSVDAVIRAKNQFSPWKDGAIYRRTASGDTKKAVVEVFDNGVRVLPSNAFFFVSKEVKGMWITDTRPYITSIGSHKFYGK